MSRTRRARRAGREAFRTISFSEYKKLEQHPKYDLAVQAAENGLDIKEFHSSGYEFYAVLGCDGTDRRAYVGISDVRLGHGGWNGNALYHAASAGSHPEDARNMCCRWEDVGRNARDAIMAAA